MKYVIALLFALTFSKIDAQNLQFSQVLTYSLTLSANTIVGTVPTGKVWKIEFIRVGTGGSVSVNDRSIANQTSSGWNQFPIWLKAEDVLTASGSSNTPESYFFSIIEFTVVP